MCGICGSFGLDGRSADAGLLRSMVSRLRHRGPDGSGVHTDAALGFGHARLNIIDVAGGHQPMATPDGSVRITFNGEIFNYIELRQELEQRGHQFVTRSDTEVILHAYREAGEDCVHRLNGEWAFAIWDAKRRKLFLSRDRLGIRPLFYTMAGRTFLFASEMKALLAHPAVNAQLDLRALDQIFTFWHTLAPRTAFQGILELPPGHSMTLEDGECTVRPYWRPTYDGATHAVRSEHSYVEELRDLLLDATRIRLRADVPVGAYLSGGLDSTLIAALAKECAGTRLKTFSVTFESPEFDESRHQDEAVRWLQTDHHAVHCSNGDIGREFPDVIRHTEQPILRTAPVPLFRLSRLVHEQGYKVVLTGEGSDEVLGGYELYKEAKIRRFWAARPDSRLRPMLLKRLYPYMDTLQKQSPAYLRAFFRVRPEDVASPFFSHLPRWELTAKLKLFLSAEVKAALGAYDSLSELAASLPPAYAAWHPFQQAQYLETTGLLPGYILSSQGDRVAMAHSVEGRVPFLDHRVVEFAARLPPPLKMKVLNEKYLLKLSAGTRIPPSVRERPKQPYRAPDAASFFTAEGRARQDYVEEMLSPTRIRQDGVFDAPAVEKLVQKVKRGHTIGVRDNMAVVGILSTQLFIHHFIRKAHAEHIAEH